VTDTSSRTNGHTLSPYSGEASTPRLRQQDALRELQVLALLNGQALLGPAAVERWFARWADAYGYLKPEWLLVDGAVS
jgi:hypothetical protein